MDIVERYTISGGTFKKKKLKYLELEERQVQNGNNN